MGMNTKATFRKMGDIGYASHVSKNLEKLLGSLKIEPANRHKGHKATGEHTGTVLLC